MGEGGGFVIAAGRYIRTAWSPVRTVRMVPQRRAAVGTRTGTRRLKLTGRQGRGLTKSLGGDPSAKPKRGSEQPGSVRKHTLPASCCIGPPGSPWADLQRGYGLGSTEPTDKRVDLLQYSLHVHTLIPYPYPVSCILSGGHSEINESSPVESNRVIEHDHTNIRTVPTVTDAKITRHPSTSHHTYNRLEAGLTQRRVTQDPRLTTNGFLTSRTT